MNASRKWILQRISALLVAPLIIWFCVSLISLSTSSYDKVMNFFGNTVFSWLTIILLVAGFFHAKIGLNEIFEDYIENEKIKNVANKLLYLFSIIIPISTLLLLYKLSI